MPRPPRPLAPDAAQRLYRAAADAFAAKGLDDASLNDILTRAGMGKGSFYHRFEDKGALHDWVTRRIVDDVFPALRAPDLGTLTAASFRSELTALLGRFAARAREEPDLTNLGLMFHNSAGASAERAISRVRASVVDWIDNALATGRNLGVIRDDLPSDLLTQWTIASLTTIDRWVLAMPEQLAERAISASTAIDVLWTLLAPE